MTRNMLIGFWTFLVLFGCSCNDMIGQEIKRGTNLTGKSSAQHPERMHRETQFELHREPGNSSARTSGMIARESNFLSIQVNVDENGQNIVGDAANEPSLAVNPLNRNQIAIGWRQFNTVNSSFRQAGVAQTVNGGLSWTNQPVLQPGVFRSDPVLTADADGNFIYSSLTSAPIAVSNFHSNDGGKTWSGPFDSWGGDKQWIEIDRTGGLGHGNIYIKWSPFFSCCPGSFTRSTDGGANYDVPVDFELDFFGGTISIGPAGAVYLCGELLNGQTVVFKSDDAQDPDSAPTFTHSFVDLGGRLGFGEGPNPDGLLGQFWIATDHSNGINHGNVYMLSSVEPGGIDPLDVNFSRSIDGGQTWSQPMRLNTDRMAAGAYQWFGTMSVAPNGRIDVIWNDSRDDTSFPFQSRLYYTKSDDGGLNWDAEIPVSPTWNPQLGHPNQAKIGDYYDMVSDDDGVDIAYAATFNGEQDIYHLRIELSDTILLGDVNQDGVVDLLDVAPFIDLLSSGKFQDEADVNQDGAVDLLDVNPFIAILIGD